MVLGARVTSRWVRVRGRGGPEVMHVEECGVPEPGPGEVRLRVEAAGVAFGDIMRRRGLLAPPWAFTPGYDVVGTVEACGPGADASGRVAVLMPRIGFGGYAEHVLVPAERTVPVPASMDPVRAVALGLNYITAFQILNRLAPVPPGGRVLVHGAAGGVGTAVLDLAAGAGSMVYGTASAGKHDLVRARGGIPIDYRTEDFVQRLKTDGGADVVIDGIGGAHLRRSLEALRPGGTLVALGISGDLDSGLLGVVGGILRHSLPLRLWPRGNRVVNYAITLSPGCGAHACRDDWRNLLSMSLSPVVGATLPLAEVREAHRLLETSAVTGKIVLVP